MIKEFSSEDIDFMKAYEDSKVEFTGTSDEELLDYLDCLREKFDESNKVKMLLTCQLLTDRGVYPIHERVIRMVEGYGAYWHIYKEPSNCTHCNTDLRNLTAGPPYKREVLIKCIHNSFAPYYECPDCKGRLGCLY